MAPRTRKKLNEASSQVIEQNILKETPATELGIPDDTEIVFATAASEIPKMKKILFINGRDPGYPLDFHYHSKTHPLKLYTLLHGKEYELPEEIIDHLEQCAELQYGYRQNSDGKPEMYTKNKKYLYSCKPVKNPT